MIDRRIFVCIVLACACVPTRDPAPQPPAPRAPEPAVAATPPLPHPADPPGRLRTGPGLCRVFGGERGLDSAKAGLELAYDERGRPATVTSRVVPRPQPCWRPAQRHVVTWTWDDADRLVGVEHTLAFLDDSEPIASQEPCEPDPADACLYEGETLLVERSSWSYAKGGMVATYAESSSDCEETAKATETLRRDGDVVTATLVRPSGRDVLRYRYDADGRVVEIVGHARFLYDEVGRLVETLPTEGAPRRVSYHAPAVGTPVHPDDTRPRWHQLERTDAIELTGPNPDGVVVNLDARRRPISIEAEHEAWTLAYGGCDNADRATHTWWLDALFDAWPWPELPAPAGESWRRAWMHESLPLGAT